MPSSPSKKSRFFPNVASIGFVILVLPVMAAIGVSLWLATASVYEDIKLARGTDQVLALISGARDGASKDPRFGQQPNEDIVNDLVRLGQYRARPSNPWGGAIRATVGDASSMRIEVDLPFHACQQLANFFGKEAGDVALQTMEAREWNSGWRQFYNASRSQNSPSLPAINAACGNVENTTLAFVVRLR